MWWKSWKVQWTKTKFFPHSWNLLLWVVFLSRHCTKVYPMFVSLGLWPSLPGATPTGYYLCWLLGCVFCGVSTKLSPKVWFDFRSLNWRKLSFLFTRISLIYKKSMPLTVSRKSLICELFLRIVTNKPYPPWVSRSLDQCLDPHFERMRALYTATELHNTVLALGTLCHIHGCGLWSTTDCIDIDSTISFTYD